MPAGHPACVIPPRHVPSARRSRPRGHTRSTCRCSARARSLPCWSLPYSWNPARCHRVGRQSRHHRVHRLRQPDLILITPVVVVVEDVVVRLRRLALGPPPLRRQQKSPRRAPHQRHRHPLPSHLGNVRGAPACHPRGVFRVHRLGVRSHQPEQLDGARPPRAVRLKATGEEPMAHRPSLRAVLGLLGPLPLSSHSADATIKRFHVRCCGRVRDGQVGECRSPVPVEVVDEQVGLLLGGTRRGAAVQDALHRRKDFCGRRRQSDQSACRRKRPKDLVVPVQRRAVFATEVVVAPPVSVTGWASGWHALPPAEARRRRAREVRQRQVQPPLHRHPQRD